MGLSQRAYAKHRGLSHTRIQQAIKLGQISQLPDGSINPVIADVEWANRVAPTDGIIRESKVVKAVERAVKPIVKVAKAKRVRAVAKVATVAKSEPVEEEEQGYLPGLDDESDGAAFLKVRIQNEVLRAEMSQARLDKMNGDVVDRAKALAMVFDLARQERNSWMTWPPRVAALMASDLGVDAHLLERTLLKYLRDHLLHLSEVQLDLR